MVQEYLVKVIKFSKTAEIKEAWLLLLIVLSLFYIYRLAIIPYFFLLRDLSLRREKT